MNNLAVRFPKVGEPKMRTLSNNEKLTLVVSKRVKFATDKLTTNGKVSCNPLLAARRQLTHLVPVS